MTLIDASRQNKMSGLVKKISRIERTEAAYIAKGLCSGHIVIPKNKKRTLLKPCGIGRGLTTKVNVNIGTSPDSSSLADELRKLKLAEDLGADTVMDLTVGKNIRIIRKKILEKCAIPLGTVPVYEIAVSRHNRISDIPESDFIDVLRKQAEDGVDFFTIHAGITKDTVKVLDDADRLIPIVSRGGAILYKWIKLNKKENPFYEHFDEVIDIAREYDITLSLGDGMRPGAIKDASDKPQYAELRLLGRLQKKALAKGVQVMIEGPGHVPLNKIKENIEMEKKLCNGAPFYVLGPLVTDIAPGYDHITSAIGGAVAAGYGADFLCYVTPAEHLRLPDYDDVRDGLIASKIAAHAADIAKGLKKEMDKDIEISKARRIRDWKKQFALALDTEKAVRYRKSSNPANPDVCTMCGNFCPIKTYEKGNA